MNRGQHEIFSRFRLTPARSDAVTYRSEVGGHYRAAFASGVVPNSRPFEQAHPASQLAAHAAGSGNACPQLNEEYFEWVDVLSAVWAYVSAAPARPFVFVELGAGFARWSVNAVCALRSHLPAAPYLVVAAEADPDHFRWMQENLLDNGVPRGRRRLFPSPVAGTKKPVLFQSGDPGNWYGQSIVEKERSEYLARNPRAQRRENSYLREPRLWDRWFGPKNPRRILAMQTITLAEVIEGLDVVDMVDMDIQGTEAEVIEQTAELLSQRVLRLHIGTHSAEVEQRIRSVMASTGWTLEQDYACMGLRETPFGPVAFGDGVQSWSNERLRSACA
ncbi:MAG TPA: hypothetical protein VF943_16385 [Burkholderiales bacterium]